MGSEGRGTRAVLLGWGHLSSQSMLTEWSSQRLITSTWPRSMLSPIALRPPW